MRTQNSALGSLKDTKVVFKQPFSDSTNVNMSNVKQTSKEKVPDIGKKIKSSKNKENSPQQNENTVSRKKSQKPSGKNKQGICSKDSEVKDSTRDDRILIVKIANILKPKENPVDRSHNNQENVSKIGDPSTNKGKQEIKNQNNTKSSGVETKYVNTNKRQCKKDLVVEIINIMPNNPNRVKKKTDKTIEVETSHRQNKHTKVLVVNLTNNIQNKCNNLNTRLDNSINTSNNTSREDNKMDVIVRTNETDLFSKQGKPEYSSHNIGINEKVKDLNNIHIQLTSSTSSKFDSETTSNSEPQESESLVQNVSNRQSVPLVKRLRKGVNKHYIEESFEDSTLTSPTVQNVGNTSKSKVPIYMQAVPILKKSVKDPYELDIVDTDHGKSKKKKNLDDSGKFNRTMQGILKKIERKEKKMIKKKPKLVRSYDENIQSVLKRIMKKVNDQKSPPMKNDPKTIPVVSKRVHVIQDVVMSRANVVDTNTSNRNNVQKKLSSSLVKIDEIEDGFRGFERTVNCVNRSDETEDGFRGFDRSTSQVSESISKERHWINEHLTSFEDKMLAASNSFSSILSEESRPNTIAFRKMIPSTHRSYTSFSSTINNPRNTPRETNITFLDANQMDNTRNLHREFQEHLPGISEDTNDDTYNYGDFEHFCSSDSEEEDDQYFGFREISETTPEKPRKFSNSRKDQPWRLPGVFKRNPYLLKVKQNGLPCGQQEMVIDYQFAKRIEAMSANKRPESVQPKPPVQTSMLEFVENSIEHIDRPSEPSLFDYEEFVVKPRRVLGLLQEHQVSTPKKGVRTALASPNISVISKPHGIPISTPKVGVKAVVTSPNVSRIDIETDQENIVHVPPLERSYRRLGQKKQLEPVSEEEESPKNKNDKDLEGALPSILDDNYEEVQDADVHLFEDVEEHKGINFSIELPVLKYERKRKKPLFEGSDDEEERISKKKKKKNMMTKAEEAEFNAWADKINARFAEEDKHELTIE